MCWSRDLNDPSFIHDSNATGDGHCFFLVVSNDHEGGAGLFLNIHQLKLRSLAQLGIQRAQRFIKQQQLGRFGKRAREGNALALPSRNLVRFPARKLFQPGQFKHLINTGRNRRFVTAFSAQTKGDVVPDGQVRKQRIGLEHHVHSPLVGRNLRNIFACQFNRARRRVFKTCEHAHHCGFPTARRAQQGKEFLRINIKGQIVDGCKIAKAFGHVAKPDKGFLIRVIPGGENSLCQGVSDQNRKGAREPPRPMIRLRCLISLWSTSA